LEVPKAARGEEVLNTEPPTARGRLPNSVEDGKEAVGEVNGLLEEDGVVVREMVS
jgi:hypothetical protein